MDVHVVHSDPYRRDWLAPSGLPSVGTPLRIDPPVICLRGEGDPLVHTAEQPFCVDPICPCHENAEAIARIAPLVTDGLLTAEEATAIVDGRLSAAAGIGEKRRKGARP